MAESIMLEKAKDLAVEIIELCKTVKYEKKESVITNQLLRRGTSVGANIHESKYGHGTADLMTSAISYTFLRSRREFHPKSILHKKICCKFILNDV